MIIHFVILGIGGRSEWIGDDFCDDINNNEKCLYDDGDCCGLSAQKNFCYECACKGKLEPNSNSKGSCLITLFPIQNYIFIIVRAMYHF